jgi:hypothetical protein
LTWRCSTAVLIFPILARGDCAVLYAS